MRDHLQRVEGAVLDLGQQILPVLVDGGLTVPDQTDAAFHESADVEVVRLFFGGCCQWIALEGEGGWWSWVGRKS